jgi:hypothetical protein
MKNLKKQLSLQENIKKCTCNNFPKAIELLKNVYDGLDYQSQGFIDKFLKEIES